MSKKKYKIGLIGAGKMGQALIEGLLETGTYKRSEICACTKRRQTSEALAKRINITCGTDPQEVVINSEIVLLAVKPHMAERVLNQVHDCWDDEHSLVSVMTGVPTDFMEEMVGRPIAVYRAMPNTPAMVGEGMSVLCQGRHTSEEVDTKIEAIFASVGQAAWIDEDRMNPSTGFSGAGTAYVYVFIEAMSDAGVKVGINRDLSLLMAAQTVKGAAEMVLKTGMHPAQLKDKVTTPAGVTIDGVMEIEDMNLRSAVIRSVVKATERAEELFKK